MTGRGYFLGRKLLLYGRSRTTAWTSSSFIFQFLPLTIKLWSAPRNLARIGHCARSCNPLAWRCGLFIVLPTPVSMVVTTFTPPLLLAFVLFLVFFFQVNALRHDGGPASYEILSKRIGREDRLTVVKSGLSCSPRPRGVYSQAVFGCYNWPSGVALWPWGGAIASCDHSTY